MKKLSLICVLFVSIASVAQVAKPLQFREETFDFGDIQEKEGPVTHQFEFTNMADRPVKILNVKPSCGCTTPDWSREPIQPGKTGFIQARFNPKGRPGHFSKSLTVTTDADASTIVLHIRGSVIVEGRNPLADYGTVNGSWRLKNASFNFGKIYLKDEFVVREYPFINNGTKPVTYLNKHDGPDYIRVSVTPETVAPGEKGIMKISYNGKMKNQYGFQSDNVTLHTDDEQQPKKSFSVFATLEDFFPPLKPEEAAKAPKLQVAESTVDFGRITQKQVIEKEVIFTNTGKSNLQVRAIQSNCTCVTAEFKDKAVKSGASTTVKISFNPQDRKGTQQKAITIYSNDPVNPVQRVTLTGYVE